MQGNFIAVVGIVRDVTGTFKDIMIDDETLNDGEQKTGTVSRQPSKPAGLFGKIFGAASGKATPFYKEGISLYKKEKKYAEAVVSFNKALEIDDKLPYIWNDLGLCYREMKDNNNALKAFTRAVELAPDNPEFLFNLGETLEITGLLNMSNKYLDSAIATFKMVINQLPNNKDAWNHIGICYKEKGQIEESKFYFDRARDIRIGNKDTPIVPKRDY
jgi:tetratricopeptide (TPR) repeat protein